MSDWKNYKLGEIVDFNTKSLTNDFRHEIIEYLDTGSITENVIDGFQYFNLKEAPSRAKRLVQEEDIIYSTVRPIQRHYGYLKIVNSNLVVSTGFAVLTANKSKVYPKYLYYWLTTDDIVNYLDSIAEGSTSAYPSLKPSDLANLEITLPPLPEQKAIAEILSSLDDKIDLLHRQNKTLEQLAETLFRQWFIEEADESWEVAKLGDVAVVQNGYAFSIKDYVPYQEEYLEVLKMGHIEKGGGLRANPKKDFVPREEKLKRWTLNKNDIVMAMTDMKDNVVILGVPAMIDKSDNYVLNQRVARIYLESTKKLLNSYLLYIQLNNKEFIATLQSKANSGVQVNISTESIKDCDIIIPPMELQIEKGTAITELYLKKENNDKQILSLTKLLDTLLQKLLSGNVILN